MTLLWFKLLTFLEIVLMLSKMVMFKIVCVFDTRFTNINKTFLSEEIAKFVCFLFFFIKHSRADRILSQYVAVSAASDTGLNSFSCIKGSIKH